jgi:hypothetical protein
MVIIKKDATTIFQRVIFIFMRIRFSNKRERIQCHGENQKRCNSYISSDLMTSKLQTKQSVVLYVILLCILYYVLHYVIILRFLS